MFQSAAGVSIRGRRFNPRPAPFADQTRRGAPILCILLVLFEQARAAVLKQRVTFSAKLREYTLFHCIISCSFDCPRHGNIRTTEIEDADFVIWCGAGVEPA
jgi:hypothetical protein